MPTASQAMILMSEDGMDSRVPRRHFSASNANAKSVSRVNISKPQRHVSMPSMETGSLENFKTRQEPPGTLPHHVILNGYRGSMYYDPELKRFRWQIVSRDKATLDNTVLTNSVTENNEDDTDTHFRPIERTEKLLPRREDLNSISVTKDNLPDVYGVDDKFYSRLEELGFRRRIGISPRKKISPNREKKAAKLKNQDTKLSAWSSPTTNDTHGFMSRSRRHSSLSQYRSLDETFTVDQSDGDVKGQSDDSDGKDDFIISKKTFSLLEEIKQKVRYDNRIYPAMYMRHSIPVNNPYAVCFSLPDENLSHMDVKRLVESKTDLKVMSIQYDPVSVRGGCWGGIGSRWVITFLTLEEGRMMVQTGMDVDGEKIMVKWLDDVMTWEYDAYLIKREDERRQKSPSVFMKKSMLKPKEDKRRSLKHN